MHRTLAVTMQRASGATGRALGARGPEQEPVPAAGPGPMRPAGPGTPNKAAATTGPLPHEVALWAFSGRVR